MLSAWIDPDWATAVCFGSWAAPAVFLPVFLMLFDDDEARVRRFVALHALVWVLLVNVLALAFLSAGPVYHDRLVGSEMFGGLDAALASSGVSGSYMGTMQAFLWSSYVAGTQEAGTGISAFPSVHVGMATVFALYLFERAHWLAVPGLVIVATFQFFSVYLGWHYTIDGYVSITVMGLIWALLRRRSATPNGVRGAALPLRRPATP